MHLETHNPAAVLFILAAILVLFIYSLFWAYGDAERRGKPGWLVVLLVALASWPLSRNDAVEKKPPMGN